MKINIKAISYAVLTLGVLATVFFGYMYVEGLTQDIKELTAANNNLKTQNTEALKKIKLQTESIKKHVERVNKLITEKELLENDINNLNSKLITETVKINKLKKEMIEKHPDWILKLINSSRKDFYKDIEDI